MHEIVVKMGDVVVARLYRHSRPSQDPHRPNVEQTVNNWKNQIKLGRELSFQVTKVD